MEFIIGILFIGVVAYLLLKPRKQEVTEAVPYKVETPVPAHDVAPQPLVVEGAGVVEVPALTEVVEAPVATETPAKKPRKPRAPKAEKPAAKKAAPKKAAAIKAKPKATKSKKA